MQWWCLVWPWYHLPWGHEARVIDHHAQQFFLCSWHPNSSGFHDWWEQFFKTTSPALVFSSGSSGQELINMSLQRFIQEISSVIKLPSSKFQPASKNFNKPDQKRPPILLIFALNILPRKVKTPSLKSYYKHILPSQGVKRSVWLDSASPTPWQR